MSRAKIKVGDLVISSMADWTRGLVGTVRAISGIGSVGVQFPDISNPFGNPGRRSGQGHNLNGTLRGKKARSGWWCQPDTVTLVSGAKRRRRPCQG